MDARITVGSAPAHGGRIVAVAPIPRPSYTPFVPAASLLNLPADASLIGASGAQASRVVGLVLYAALGVGRATYSRVSDVALSPASVYKGRNRLLAIVRSKLYSGTDYAASSRTAIP